MQNQGVTSSSGSFTSEPIPAIRGHTVVMMPGTGSDDDFVTRAFGPAVTAAGANLLAVRPEPEDLVGGYRRAVDRAAHQGPVVVGGVSIGAAIAVLWALENPGLTVAVLAAMPAWTGDAGSSPASVSARATAQSLRKQGLAAVTEAMRSSSPRWLGNELARSWAVQWPRLPDALEQVADFAAPTPDDLRRLHACLAVAAVSDDPLHPAQVAEDWTRWAPRAAVRSISLDQLGSNPALLGHACLAALSDTAGTSLP